MAAIGGRIDTRTSEYAQTRVLQKIVSHRAVETPPFYPNVYQEIGNDPRRSFMDVGSYAELGTFMQKNEGDAPAFDQPFELIPTHFEFYTYSLASSVTREAQDEDPLDLMGKLAPMLADSERVTKDLIYWNTFNFGFNPLVTLYDGQPLFSASHLLSPVVGDTGPISKIGMTYSNSLGNAQVTPDTIRLGELLFELTLSDRALPASRSPLYLMCHPNIAKICQEMVGSRLEPGTDTNTINTEYGVVKVLPNRYLTNTNAWFLVGAPGFPNGNGHQLITSHKRQYDVLSWFDPITRAWNISEEFRSTFGPIDWRSLVGSQGAGA
jgi:hypothetical protein